MADEPTTLFANMPKGDLFIYSGFLVFLTLTSMKPGYFLSLTGLIQEVASTLKTIYSGPEAIIIDGLKQYFSKHYNEEELARAMTNPNSFYIPLAIVRAVKKGFKLTQGSYIKVILPNNSFIIEREISLIPIKTVYQLISPKWRNVVKMLQEVAQENTAKR